MNDIDGPKKIQFGLRMATIGVDRSTAKIKVGAALVDKGRIVIASNIIRTSPDITRKGYKYENQYHAEFNLFSRDLRQWPINIKGTVFVVRLLADGSFGLAKPCPSCWNYLKKIGIKKVVYTVYGGYVEEKL